MSLKRACILLLMFLSVSVSAKEKKKESDLKSCKAENAIIYFSDDVPEEEVKSRLNITNEAIVFYNENINPQKIFTRIYLLSRKDWSDFTPLFYGMPHTAAKDLLILAYEDNDFWKSTIPNEAFLGTQKMQEFKKVYGVKNGDIQMKNFFDLLAVHELGHIIADQSNVAIPYYWFNEFFVNYFLHAFIEEKHPELLKRLVLSPNINVKLLAKEKFKTLVEFENNYGSKMTGPNYAWYQSRFHQIAQITYENEKLNPLQRIFKEFSKKQKFKDRKSFLDFVETNISAEVANQFRNF